MSDAHSLDAPAEMIGALIDSFFAALKESSDSSGVAERPAEMAYELDQVVSAYLDEHQLSPEAYHQIEQDVLNTLAADLHSFDLDAAESSLTYDADGNADPLAVLVALDQRFDDLLSSDTDPVAALDSALDSSLFQPSDFDSGSATDFPSDSSFT